MKQAMEGSNCVSVLATRVTRISILFIQVINLALFLKKPGLLQNAIAVKLITTLFYS